jgi:chromosomal replication initiation ATPase DnaA
LLMQANIWDEVRSRFHGKVNRLSYDTWFSPTTFVADDGRSVTVRVPSLLFRDWIVKHYSGVIAASLEEVHRAGALISFVVDESRAGLHSINDRFDRVDSELGAIRRDVGLILAKLSST